MSRKELSRSLTAKADSSEISLPTRNGVLRIPIDVFYRTASPDDQQNLEGGVSETTQPQSKKRTHALKSSPPVNSGVNETTQVLSEKCLLSSPPSVDSEEAVCSRSRSRKRKRALSSPPAVGSGVARSRPSSGNDDKGVSKTYKPHSQKRKGPLSNPPAVGSDEKTALKCPICDFVSNTAQNHEQHLHIHGDAACDIFNEGFIVDEAEVQEEICERDESLIEDVTNGCLNNGFLEKTEERLRPRAAKHNEDYAVSETVDSSGEEYVPETSRSSSSGNSQLGNDSQIAANAVTNLSAQEDSTLQQSDQENNSQIAANAVTNLSAQEDSALQQSDQENNSLLEKAFCEDPSNAAEQVIDEDFHNIRVVSTNNSGVRSYDKKHFCLFCGKPQSKLPRHLECAHPNEPEVAKLLALPKSAKDERELQLTRLRNRGNYRHNQKVLADKKGDFIVVYRPKGHCSARDYLPCSDCLGFYCRTELWRHVQNCRLSSSEAKGSGQKGKSRAQSQGKLMLLGSIDSTSNSAFNEVLSKMKEDAISLVARNDRLIMKYGRSCFDKHGPDAHQSEHVRRGMRCLARLLTELRNKHSSKTSLVEFMTARCFTQLVDATREVAGFDEILSEFQHPSVALKLGQALHRCAHLVRSQANQDDDLETSNRATLLLQCMDTEWPTLINAHAHRTSRKRQRAKVLVLPATADVFKLAQHVYEEGEKAFKKLSDGDYSAYSSLRDCCLTSIMTFNRRRQGEVSRLLVTDVQIKRGKPANSDMMEMLSDFEKDLVENLERVEVRGKRDRTVPLIFTPTMKRWLDILLKARHQAGVLDSNPYVFARLSPSNMHARGSDTIRRFGEQCGASRPETLRGTLLRKQIATACQILNLRDNELDYVANYLGHDIRVHRHFYRLPEAILQLAKVSKLLFAMENGRVIELKGKNLDEIKVRGEEEIAYADDDDDLNQYQSDDEDGKAKQMPQKQDQDMQEDVSDETGVHEIVGAQAASQKTQQGKKQFERRVWQAEEKAAVTRHFLEQISVGKIPGKEEIEDAQRREPSLRRRTWRNIKDFVRNKIKEKFK